jgi:hypothetical protein
MNSAAELLIMWISDRRGRGCGCPLVALAVVALVVVALVLAARG